MGGGNFWTGAGVGGLLGYMFGARNNTGKFLFIFIFSYVILN